VVAATADVAPPEGARALVVAAAGGETSTNPTTIVWEGSTSQRVYPPLACDVPVVPPTAGR
jgi:hypothetical protein